MGWIRKIKAGSRMGGPPIAFKTLTFLIGHLLRKLAFYAPLPHFENPCLLELPIAQELEPLSSCGSGAGHGDTGA